MVGEYVLKKNGIDPRKDTNLIQNIEFANIANAFASGTGEFVHSLNRLQAYSKKKVKVISSLHSEMNLVLFLIQRSWQKKVS